MLRMDSTNGKVVLAAAKYQEPAAGAPSNAPPEMIPGSMHLLVYGLARK